MNKGAGIAYRSQGAQGVGKFAVEREALIVTHHQYSLV